jgi:hypothetical protein
VAKATFNSLSDMPPAVKTLSTRYAIKLLGNPATIVAKRAALEGEATMVIAADHMLALLLPDAFDRVSYQPLIGVPLSMFEYFLYTGLILDGPVCNAGVHFAMEPARLAQLHFDLNDSDAYDDESTAGGQHSTSRGVHNLAMVGDMPIAQVTMIELLHTLDAALHGGESPAEIEYRTIRIAVQAGYKRTERSTLPAIQAACRHLCRPRQFPSAESAAAASCSKDQTTRLRQCIRQCTFWVTRIRQCIADETGDTTTAVSSGRTDGAGSSVDPPTASSHGQTPGGAGSSADSPSVCSLEEVAALDGLISLGDRERMQQPPRSSAPPSFPPSPPVSISTPKAHRHGGDPPLTLLHHATASKASPLNATRTGAHSGGPTAY